MADIALSSLGLVASIPASIDAIIELARKSSALNSNRLNALTGWENLGHDFSSLKANAKYLKENCSTGEEYLFRMQLEELSTILCALKIELDNVEKIVQRRRTRSFPSTLQNEVKAVAEDLEKVHGILRFVCENITERRQRERNGKEDFFIIGQNLAEKPRGVEVLDFDTRDENGKRETMEGQLLDEVLALDVLKKITATSQGYGGVGKSCALRGIAHHPEVQNRFWGGILFVTLGQEAGEGSLQDHLSWMVQITGGKEKAKEVAAVTLERSVQATGTWFSEYPCLFLFDDVWCGKTLGPEAIDSLWSIARHQQSRLVFTTRQVPFESDVTIRFEHRPVESQVSRNILLSTAGFGGEPECPSALEAFHKLLRVARGLPLRLALIGGGVRKKADLYDDIKREEAWKIFNWGEAEDASIEEKDILLSLLSYMDEGDSERFYYKSFMSLCVLRYAQGMPMRVVSQLWGLSESEGQKLAEALAEVNIVRISKVRRDDKNCGDMMTVGLHDIMLDVARKEAQKDDSDVCYASRLINSYLRKSHGKESESVCDRTVMWCEKEHVDVGIDSEGVIYTKSVSEGDGHVYQAATSSDVGEVACGGWCAIGSDGYFYENFCWLLLCAKLMKELLWLISQPSWLIGQMNNFGFGQAEDDLRLTIQCTSDISRLAVSEDTIQSVKLVKSAVSSRKVFVRFGWWRWFYWFQMYGRLLCFANQSEWVRNYIQKIEQVAPRPWYRPSVGCLAPADNSVHTILPIKKCDGCCLNDNDLIYWSSASEERRDVEINTYSLSEECEKEKWVLKSDEIDDWIKVIDCDVEESDRTPDVNASSSAPSSTTRKEKWTSRVKKLFSRSSEKDESQSEVSIESVCDEGGQTRTSDDDIEISKVSVSRDSKNVVACMIDGSVRLWTLEDEKWNCTAFTGHPDEVIEVGIGQDGTRFVSVSSDRTMRFWFKRDDGNWYSTVNKELHSIYRFEMSADGNCVVLVSWTESKSAIYVLQLGERGKVMKIEISEDIRAVAINKNGTCVSASLRNGGLYVWTYDGGNWRKTMLEGERLFPSVAFNGDGNCVVTAVEDGMEVWQFEGGIWHRKVLKGDCNVFFRAASNEAGTFVCGLSYQSIYVWEVLEAMDTLPPEEDLVLDGDVSIGESNNRIVGYHANKVMVWELERKKWKRTVLEHSSDGRCVGSNGSGGCVVGSGKETMVWELEGKKWKRIDLEHSSVVTCVGSNGSGGCVVGSGKETMVWELEGKKWKRIDLEHSSVVTCVGSNGSGSCVVCGSWEGTVQMWRLENGEWRNIFLKNLRDRSVDCVNINEAGSCVVVGLQRYLMQEYVVLVLKLIDDEWQETELTGHTDDIRCLKINAAGNLVVSGSWDKSVRLWKLEDGQWNGTIVGEHTDDVRAVAANENWTRIVFASDDDTVRVWAKKSESWESTVLKCDVDYYSLRGIDISKCGKFILCQTFGSEVFAWRQVEEKWESTDSPNGEFSERWARQATRYRFPDLWRNEVIGDICDAIGGDMQYETRGSFFLTVPRKPYLVRVDEIQ